MTPRDTARAWLDDPLGVVLDFETTALDGYAVEVGIVSMTGEALLHARLKPLAPMDPRAEAVHGITLDALEECPTFAQMQGRLREVLHGRNVVAYNAAFDCGVFQRERARLTLNEQADLTPLSWRCAMLLWGQHLGVRKWQRLPGGDHSALGDCRAALEVVRRIAGAPCAELARTRLACAFRCLDCNKVVGPTVTSRGEALPTRCGRDV